jgi:cystathionine beta-synthase
LVVVVLPDSGARYLSKIFDDEWMRENGFMETTWSQVPLSEILAVKSFQGLVSACDSDRMTDVIALMKEHDISQVPALNSKGELVGLVSEVDLLEHMLDAGHTHTPDETVEQIMRPAQAVFSSNTPLEAVLPSIVEGQVVLVTEAEHPIGILTKIDVLDFISQEI